MTKATRTRAVPILAALMIILMATLTTACSSDTTEPETGPSQRDLLDTIERMDREMDTLHEEIAELREPGQTQVSGERDQQRQGQPANYATSEPIDTPANEIAATPTHSGPGICGRSPAVQEAILHTLRTPSCQIVTNEELYRITKFRNLLGNYEEPKWSQLKAGDLEGLINLESMSISGDITLTAGTFSGAGIKDLKLSGVTISPNAFENMVSIDSLSLHGMEEFPVLDARSLRDLRQLIVDFEAPFPDLTGDEVEHLTNLQQVKLSGELYAGMEEAEIPQGDTPGRKFRIPANLFRANTLLRSVHIDIDGRGRGDYNFTVSVPHRLVSHLDYLESLSIYDPHVEGHRPGMAPLELASESPLAKHLKVPESMPKGWQNTKQFMDLERWSNWSNGYELLVFTGDDDWIDLGN